MAHLQEKMIEFVISYLNILTVVQHRWLRFYYEGETYNDIILDLYFCKSPYWCIYWRLPTIAWKICQVHNRPFVRPILYCNV